MKRIVLSLALLFTFASPVLAADTDVPALVDAGPGSGSAATLTTPATPAATEGSGSATAPAPVTAAPAPAVITPTPEDIGLLAKLWKNGAFFSIGIIAVYVGLVAWSKLDKKHAFYAATGAAGLVGLIEAIRKGDAPTLTAVLWTLTTTIGVLVAGPGHTPAGK